MKDFIDIYEQNKILDESFVKECNISSDEMNQKNLLELLVELGELANETRCFKYWSCKAPSSKDIIIEEYSDCLMLTLYFCNILDVSLDEEFPKYIENNIVDQFIYLYKEVSSLQNNLDVNIVKNILSNLIRLGHQLGYNNQDIIDAYYKKNNKNIERMKTNFAY